MNNISVSCGEIQSSLGFLYVVSSVVFSQTLNPDCEQSWYSQIHYSHVTMFRVRNESAVTPDVLDKVTPSLQLSDLFWWLFALCIVILIFIFIISMCFMLRKRIFRCFPKASPSVHQCDDSGIRDPESGVQIKVRSESPDSLNHSESDQFSFSVSRG